MGQKREGGVDGDFGCGGFLLDLEEKGFWFLSGEKKGWWVFFHEDLIERQQIHTLSPLRTKRKARTKTKRRQEVHPGD